MKFPPVTFWSNLRAKEVATALAACQKGQNFMAVSKNLNCLFVTSLLRSFSLAGGSLTSLIDEIDGFHYAFSR